MNIDRTSIYGQLAAALAKKPFKPFVIETTDGRRVEVAQPHSAVLNSLAISVVEEAFSVTVLGLNQIRGIVPDT